MKSILSAVLAISCWCSISFSDAIVDKMGADFISKIPQNWSYQKGTWEYFDVAKCFTQGTSCFGNNPTTPYGFPVLRYDSAGNGLLDFKFKPNDALVLIFRAPPKMRYFGLTQYLFMRSGQSTPVFASLSDTFNSADTEFETSLKAIDGSQAESLFDKYIAVVWTADLNTKNSIVGILNSQGISNINFIPMPYNLPLNLGEEQTADSFAMLMRNAMPDVQANFDAYKAEKPFFVLKVGPSDLSLVSPAPILGYRVEGSGSVESAVLKSSLDVLVGDIRKNYASRFSFNEQSVNFVNKIGWDCIQGTSQCNGDNHDALYSADLSKMFKPVNLKDAVLVVGVNHQLTKKALYQNHSVYDMEKLAGIISVNDSQFTVASALYHAGFSVVNETKRKQYQNLYAYFISYDCSGLKYCMQVPKPTPENPVGLEPGTPFYVLGRAYVDPITGVRPSVAEIVKHRSFILFKK